MDKNPIVVVGVMDSELCYLIDHLCEAKTITRGDFTFTEGRIDGSPVVVVKCSVGRMINAAAATMLAIENMRRDA